MVVWDKFCLTGTCLLCSIMFICHHYGYYNSICFPSVSEMLKFFDKVREFQELERQEFEDPNHEINKLVSDLSNLKLATEFDLCDDIPVSVLEKIAHFAKTHCKSFSILNVFVLTHKNEARNYN